MLVVADNEYLRITSVCKYAKNKKNDVYKENNVIFDKDVNLLAKYSIT